MKYLLTTLLVLTVGCVSASVEDTSGAHEMLHFPAPLPVGLDISRITCSNNGPVFDTQDSTQFDLHDYLSEMQKVGTITVKFTDDYLQGNLMAFKHAELFLKDVHGTSSQLAETDFQPVNGRVNVPILMDQKALVDAMAAGPITVTAHLQTCIPDNLSQTLDIRYTLGFDLTMSVNKGL